MGPRYTRGGGKPRPPLDAGSLEALAIHYVGRYATTRAKLRTYLGRKVRERGWDGTKEPAIAALAERFAELGYVDDASFAQARAGALSRRGFGERRVGEALRAAGIEADIAEPIRAEIGEDALQVALAFARRRRIGPFAREKADVDQRRRAIAALLRAGHSLDIARRIVSADPGTNLDVE